MTDLNELPSGKLVTAHNSLVALVLVGDPPAEVKKFSDKKTAVRRVTELLGRINTERRNSGAPIFQVTETGEIEQEATETVVETPALTEEELVAGIPDDMAETQTGETGLETADDPDAGTAIGPGETIGDEEPAPTATETAAEEPASTPPVAPKADARPKKNLGGKPPLVGETDVIILLHSGPNPKRALAADRFTNYRTGMTVAEYIRAVDSRKQGLRDIAWDMRQKWIRIVGAAQAEAEIAKLRPPAQPEAEPAKTDEPAAA